MSTSATSSTKSEDWNKAFQDDLALQLAAPPPPPRAVLEGDVVDPPVAKKTGRPARPLTDKQVLAIERVTELVPDALRVLRRILRSKRSANSDRLRAAEIVCKYSIPVPQTDLNVNANLKLYAMVRHEGDPEGATSIMDAL